MTYESNIHEPYSNTYLIDFSQQRGLSSGEPSLYRIADDVKQIQKDMNNLSTGFKRLEVISYTKEDIEKENKRRMSAIKEAISNQMKEQG